MVHVTLHVHVRQPVRGAARANVDAVLATDANAIDE